MNFPFQSYLDSLNQIHQTFLDHDFSGSEAENFKSGISNFINNVLVSLIRGEIDFVDINSQNNIYDSTLQFIVTWSNEFVSELEKFSVFQEFIEPVLQEVVAILKEYFSIINLFKATSNHLIFQHQNFIDTNFPILKELAEYCNLNILDYTINDNLQYFEKLGNLRKRKEIQHLQIPYHQLNVFEFKLQFLEYKWLKRRKYNILKLKEKLGRSYTEKYIFDKKIIDLSQPILIGERYYETYKDWINKIDFHYFEEYNRNDYQIDIQENNLYSIFKAVKIYKDISPNLEELKKLKSSFSNFVSDDFPISSKNKNLLYYYNNLFSKLSSNLENHTEVESLFTVIKELYEENDNKNFFLYYKYLDFKIRKAYNDIKNRDFSKIDIIYLNSLLSICVNSFEWSKKSFNRIFDFDRNNSIIHISGLQVYHPSSFMLPLSIVENDQLIDNLRTSLQKLEYDIFQAKSSLLISDVTEQVKGSDKRSVEIISIFTAVISFIVGTVASYQFIKTLVQGLIFMGVLGTILSLFVFMILLATRGRSFFLQKYKWAYFVIPYIAILIILGVLFSYYNANEAPKAVKETQMKIDSLEKIKSNLNAEIKNLKKVAPANSTEATKTNSKTNDNQNYH